MSLVVRRTDYAAPHSQILGFDVDAEEAAAIVADGRGEYAEVDPPAAVYVLQATSVRGQVHPAGAMLAVDGEVTAPEALALLRGQVARGEAFASAPQRWTTRPRMATTALRCSTFTATISTISGCSTRSTRGPAWSQ